MRQLSLRNPGWLIGHVFFKILDYVWLRNIYIDITSVNNEAFIIIGKS